MVDVSAKAATERVAVAEGRVVMAAKTLDLVLAGNAKKGDVLGAARIAGIMAAKRTHELIPLCHPLAVSKIAVDIEPDRARVRPERARDRQGNRADRGRDGSADGGRGRLPDHLRHGEGGRARHAHRGHPARREARRQIRTLSGEGVSRGAHARRRSASARARRGRAAACRTRAARGRLRTRAGCRCHGVAHPAAGGRIGYGRLRRARGGRCRRYRSISSSSAKWRPGIRSRERLVPARPRGSSRAASCLPAPIRS